MCPSPWIATAPKLTRIPTLTRPPGNFKKANIDDKTTFSAAPHVLHCSSSFAWIRGASSPSQGRQVRLWFFAPGGEDATSPAATTSGNARGGAFGRVDLHQPTTATTTARQRADDCYLRKDTTHVPFAASHPHVHPHPCAPLRHLSLLQTYPDSKMKEPLTWRPLLGPWVAACFVRPLLLQIERNIHRDKFRTSYVQFS
jgi:hypothetical protein